MAFEDAIPVEDPRRAAQALAALRGGLSCESDKGGWTVAEPDGLIRFAPRATGGSLARLRVETDHPIEQIVELACTIGFHAEPIDEDRTVECWIDEYLLIEARPALAALHQRLAA